MVTVRAWTGAEHREGGTGNPGVAAKRGRRRLDLLFNPAPTRGAWSPVLAKGLRAALRMPVPPTA